MPHRFVLERAVGTHSNSVQRALCPLTSTYSVVYLFSQSYFNTKFIIAPRHSGFIPFCALSAAKGMVIAMRDIFYYDESEHSRKTNYGTVTSDNYYDICCLYELDNSKKHCSQTKPCSLVKYNLTEKKCTPFPF
jgi:hypothetical protein